MAEDEVCFNSGSSLIYVTLCSPFTCRGCMNADIIVLASMSQIMKSLTSLVSYFGHDSMAHAALLPCALGWYKVCVT